MPDHQLEKIHEMLEDFDTAMLVTHAHGQPMHGRPMAIARLEPNCDFWFFTGRDSLKVHEIDSDHHALVVCQDEHDCYLSISGTAELVSDRNKMHALWKETYRTWFPGGVDDPNLMLIFVRAEQAEYWDNQGAKGVKYFFQSVAAYATGTTPHAKEGEQHAKLNLK